MEPKTKPCPQCDGHGVIIQAECCGNSRYLEAGDCCGNAIPVQVQCDYCKATGEIELTEDELQDEHESRLDDEAEKMND